MPERWVDPSFPAADPDGVTLWWLGQATVAVRHADTLVLIDPYLSDSLAEKYRGTVYPHTRMVPVPVQPDRITGVTAVLCSHGHTDHMDPGTIPALQVGSDPVFVVPRAERVKAIDRGVPADRLVGVTAGESVRVGDMTVQVVPSAHEQLTYDDAGDLLHVGYVVDAGGLRIYHSGDCVPFDGQAELLRSMDVHLALLPVNGRDEDRTGNGVPGNFHLDEAVDLCRAAAIPALMCIHWGMFDFNTVDPADLRRALASGAGDVAWTVPDLGVPYVVGPGRLRRHV